MIDEFNPSVREDYKGEARIDDNETLLMIDSTLGDGPAEHVMDYIISYTLRSVNNSRQPVFASYCRRILFKLLNLVDKGQFIKSVKVWKQWQFTDLSAEIILEDETGISKHALLIENKYYSGVRLNKAGILQTDIYKHKMTQHYSGTDFNLHFALITGISRGSDLFRIYDCVQSSGFNVFSIYDFIESGQEDCESDIFNQFWLRSWS
ncbi:MAG: hypothetical protein HDT07_00145 [Bacteroidales bacterium]|nr:hypothetical protein [Bacteroidales bacterium]